MTVKNLSNYTGDSELCGKVLVAGGGIAGIQAALDLSAAGFGVYLVEEKPAIGGNMSRLDKTFPTGDCATCIVSPKLVACTRDQNIEVLTQTELIGLEGKAGNFTAKIKSHPRFVDLDKCTGCGDCSKVCPVEVTSEFDSGIGSRKAVDKMYAQAAPNATFIQKHGRAPCSTGCPIDHSVQGYVALIGAGKFKEAAELIRTENPLPSICGRVCFHPCETQCNRAEIDEPINICGLKRFALDQSPAEKPSKDFPKSGKAVAIIGSGPSGLAAAHSLSQMGHDVTVFESLPVLGGMLAVGIPEYRLPPEVLETDINYIKNFGVKFKTKHEIGNNVLVKSLENDFNAFFVATGAHNSNKLQIPGEDKGGVVHGVDFLRRFRIDNNNDVGQNVVIVGGGNTAIDAARTAKRLGAENVTMLYRRTRQEMPASPEEIDATLEEGIKIEYLVAPVEILGDQTCEKMKCIRMELGEPDSSGRRRPVPVEGSEFDIKIDMVIPAVSQSTDEKLASQFDLEVSKWGTIVTDDLTNATSKDGVFAGGDVVQGPSSVIEAIADGKRAATSIDNYLSSKPLNEGLKPRHNYDNPLSKDALKEKRRKIERAKRLLPEEISASARQGNFSEVVQQYSVNDAQNEAARCLNCAGCSECMQCVTACGTGAIDHSHTPDIRDVNVGAVVLTPGYDAFDATRRSEFGFEGAQNVVTNMQFERILSAAGPTGGQILRPSDKKHPKKLAFVQCVGSRDVGCDNEYCSSVCCMATTKEAILAKEHEPDLEVTVFYIDLRAFGKDFDKYAERAKKMGVKYIRAMISRTFENPITDNLEVTYTDKDMNLVCEEFDMMVLSLGLEPRDSLVRQADELAVELNQFGFAKTNDLNPLETSRLGVFVGGAFQEPKDIPDTVMQASAAAAKAMALLAPARGNSIKKKVYPAERWNNDEPARIGVFVCHCGSNIASVVDIQKVVSEATKLPNVVVVDNNVYTCSDDGQDIIKEKIKEHRLNRVLVASCTPRTHGPIFKDTLKDAGLNPYLLEMANIRDQCSWVHSQQPEAATAKAADLVKMAVGRTARLEPLMDQTVAINNGALVIGGGIAGMTTSLSLADQGFPVNMVEQSSTLGGMATKIPTTLEGDDVGVFLHKTIGKVISHPLISVHKNATVSKVDGHIGHFTSQIKKTDTVETVTSGVVVVSTGAKEKPPTSYNYGASDTVITQIQCSERLGKDELSIPADGTVVMIQCVEQRTEDRPYCSRVCCTTAVKNSLAIKEKYPHAKVVVLYRDMRTYGFREAAYREARQKGVLFIRFDESAPPKMIQNGTMSISVHEPALGKEVVMHPDLLVLAAPVVAADDRNDISELLKVPLNADGFFVEAHMKLRPVDFASEGLFLCGTAHAPKFISETISQANAVAGRAATILSKKEMAVSAEVAHVDANKCISCMTCVHVCPYLAPMVGKDNKAEIQGAVCMGCGSCTSECPAKAITLHHYGEDQVMAALDGLLSPPTENNPVELQFPESAGIAVPRWRRG